MTTADYIRPSVSNGNPREQALIRRWWHEAHGAKGRIVWEYYLGDCYVDALWFPEANEHGSEISGFRAPLRYPILGESVYLCEAKRQLTPELIGQALGYSTFARRAGAEIKSTLIFAEFALPEFVNAAQILGLEVVLP